MEFDITEVKKDIAKQLGIDESDLDVKIREVKVGEKDGRKI